MVLILSTNKRVYVKVYETPSGMLVAACDEELLGTTLEDPERNLKVYISPDFYKGRLIQLSELSDLLEGADAANLVGDEAVSVAMKIGLVHPNAIFKVRGVPIAYFTRI